MSYKKLLTTLTLLLCICSCSADEPDPQEGSDPQEQGLNINLSVEAHDDAQILTYASNTHYRYGPSIVKYDDGSMDMWISSPGNSGTQWDWIRYRHSEDGINWSDEQIVLKPTPGSRDQCSVCDPGVAYFGGYYYLAYTGTDDYEMDGYNNSAFVARSQYPDGPFEKWNGESWGGDPQPIIEYKETREGWGIGEVSFVIQDEELYLYYTYADLTGAYVKLCKAELKEDWPSSISDLDVVLPRENQDSLDVVYDDRLQIFIGFSMNYKMSQDSSLAIYASKDGMHFEMMDETKSYIEDYAHSVGISKDMNGHIDSSENQLFDYSYGEKWGRWDNVVQTLELHLQ